MSEFQLYRTPEDVCDLIAGRSKQNKLIILQKEDLGHWPEKNVELHEAGYWLRFQNEKRTPPAKPILHTVYNKEACPNCTACKPSRIAVVDFSSTEKQRELMEQTPFKFDPVEKPDGEAHRNLAIKYQTTRHEEDGAENAGEFWDIRSRFTKCGEFRDESGRIIAGVLFQMTRGIAVGDYYYYDPAILENYPQTPLYIKLALIEYLKTQNISHLYLGPWTNEPTALSTKARLPGLEIMDGTSWRRLTSKERKTAMSAYYKQFSPDMP